MPKKRLVSNEEKLLKTSGHVKREENKTYKNSQVKLTQMLEAQSKDKYLKT